MTHIAATDIIDVSADQKRLFIPALAGFYDTFAKPFAWTALRLAVGAVLAYEGWVKMNNPMALSGFVESLGFYPGWLWSPAMAAVNLVGGICIMLGLLTRPWALANTFMLGVTLWYHQINPYGPTFLTPEGMQFLATPEAAQYFTGAGMKQLADGGAKFLGTVQGKAIFASLFWTGACGLYAAFGGGAWSVDKRLKKEF
ncbi:MAG: DoxX family protein [Candidatus Devosia phytovorans]|uniref:DoxX family protein n=1 Tax=Candidatus Devosia phytovorans TaxID=3121372 RepID=A0AAJ5VVE3_9HYPH|nr:DoxX family protein [Devosia sp.]WEK05608.1 MAG: DoxX family protein [Devosia sp.]